ncbi:MAG: methylated-DNA--[Kiritimatiellae bacterium]|nr:methylated-DNA--[protein]-cysteine S-methyltransferase [Kiritimatiellia bacterium]MBR0196683.1 methylated-DNA--[protein]-cysteine S-methyltransferase [Kiritimatiellia bacterium]MBR0196868.1 methylated-DNA--[protein]-cysteine S-methyltransferase [Kiritimatiellia bacterium]
MTFKCKYKTPKGFSDMWMNSDGEVLTGLWFEGSRDQSKHTLDCKERDLPVFREMRRWLDIYFSGRKPDFTPSYRIGDLTPFRRAVVDAMRAIPFGETTTYGDIAAAVAKKRGIAKMSARAVGGAVGWNPICIIIPCHRVIGADGRLTGYGGGLANKSALLRHERKMLKYKEGELR